jgi:hypothetical protein
MDTNARWFVKDGSIFSENETVVQSKYGTTYKYNEAIAFNIGNDLANHMVKLHNEHIYSRIHHSN